AVVAEAGEEAVDNMYRILDPVEHDAIDVIVVPQQLAQAGATELADRRVVETAGVGDDPLRPVVYEAPRAVCTADGGVARRTLLTACTAGEEVGRELRVDAQAALARGRDRLPGVVDPHGRGGDLRRCPGQIAPE